jgi:hypothetical protein
VTDGQQPGDRQWANEPPVSSDRPDERRQRAATASVAGWIAIGIGIGVAIGVATGNLVQWIVIGIVIGIASGVAVSRRDR